MKKQLHISKIAKGLGAKPKGKVHASGGCFGALQLVEEIVDRFHAPVTGGRSTNPDWTERQLIPLAAKTLKRLEEISAQVSEHSGVGIEPMQ